MDKCLLFYEKMKANAFIFLFSVKAICVFALFVALFLQNVLLYIVYVVRHPGLNTVELLSLFTCLGSEDLFHSWN